MSASEEAELRLVNQRLFALGRRRARHGWFNDNLILVQKRNLRLSGVRWVFSAALRARFDGFSLSGSVRPASPLSTPDEARLRSEGAYALISERFHQLGYEGGWEVAEEIGGSWARLWPDISGAMAAWDEFRRLSLSVASTGARLNSSPRRPTAKTRESYQRNAAALLKAVLNSGEEDGIVCTIPRLNWRERLGGKRWSVNSCLYASAPDERASEGLRAVAFVGLCLPGGKELRARDLRHQRERLDRFFVGQGYVGQPLRPIRHPKHRDPIMWCADYERTVAANRESLDAQSREMESLSLRDILGK
jgi:hypothetical protein